MPANGAKGVFLGDWCNRVGTPAHEILHALGRWHEHTRPDRDDYVDVDSDLGMM